MPKKKKAKLVMLKTNKIEKVKGSTENFHIYTFGGLKETNKWLMENNYA